MLCVASSVFAVGAGPGTGRDHAAVDRSAPDGAIPPFIGSGTMIWLELMNHVVNVRMLTVEVVGMSEIRL